ncbi:MAG: serine/threonine protein kinase [Candidatus Obscuribacterales bacterium]|nr:serine/threonine protein kinase [Candidatus Obscuribacterales bacterium]
MTDSPSDFPSGFEMIELLGSGGHGSVYKALSTLTERIVALKILNSDASDDMRKQIERIQAEAKILARLKHPNIVQVFQVGITESGRPFLVFEYLEGKTLAEFIKERGGRLDAGEILSIFSPLLDALGFAHENGLLHRDIKPANIMLLEGDESESFAVKLLDFGIARELELCDPENPGLTETTLLSGSPAYMSPEQCRGGRLDTSSDLYSLSCVLFEALYSKPPFVGDSDFAVQYKQIHSSVEELPELKAVSAELRKFLTKALSKSASERISSASMFKEQLELALAQNQSMKLSRPLFFVLLFSMAFVISAVVFKSTMVSKETPINHPRTGAEEGYMKGRSPERHLLSLCSLADDDHVKLFSEENAATVYSNIDRIISETASSRILNYLARTLKVRVALNLKRPRAELNSLLANALEKSRLADAKDSFESAEIYIYQGNLLLSDGKYQESEGLYRKAIALCEKVKSSEGMKLQLPPLLQKFESPYLESSARENLALNLIKQNKYERAAEQASLAACDLEHVSFSCGINVRLIELKAYELTGRKKEYDALLADIENKLASEDIAFLKTPERLVHAYNAIQIG